MGPQHSLCSTTTWIYFMPLLICFSFLVYIPQSSSIFSVEEHGDPPSLLGHYILNRKNQYASLLPQLDKCCSSIIAWWHGELARKPTRTPRLIVIKAKWQWGLSVVRPYFLCLPKDPARQCLLSLPPDKPQLPRRIYTVCHIQAISWNRSTVL